MEFVSIDPCDDRERARFPALDAAGLDALLARADAAVDAVLALFVAG